MTRISRLGSNSAVPDLNAIVHNVMQEIFDAETDLMSALALVLFAVPVPAQSAKNPELQKIADAFVAAWNKGDPKALTALFAENGISADSFG